MSTANVTPLRWDGLPREIRNQIYLLLFIADGALTPGQPISLSAQILRCNKTTYDEAHLLLWQNVFDISGAKVSQLIFDISNPKKDRDELDASPEHLPIILWSRKVRHVELYSQHGHIFGYYYDYPMCTISLMPKLESFCMTIRETNGVGIDSGRPYWTKSGPNAPYQLRGLTKRFLVRVVEYFMDDFPSVKLYLSMKTLQGKILHWQAQRTTVTDPSPCITFVDRTPKQQLMNHVTRSALGPPSKRLMMDCPTTI